MAALAVRSVGDRAEERSKCLFARCFAKAPYFSSTFAKRLSNISLAQPTEIDDWLTSFASNVAAPGMTQQGEAVHGAGARHLAGRPPSLPPRAPLVLRIACYVCAHVDVPGLS